MDDVWGRALVLLLSNMFVSPQKSVPTDFFLLGLYANCSIFPIWSVSGRWATPQPRPSRAGKFVWLLVQRQKTEESIFLRSLSLVTPGVCPVESFPVNKLHCLQKIMPGV